MRRRHTDALARVRSPAHQRQCRGVVGREPPRINHPFLGTSATGLPAAVTPTSAQTPSGVQPETLLISGNSGQPCPDGESGTIQPPSRGPSSRVFTGKQRERVNRPAIADMLEDFQEIWTAQGEPDGQFLQAEPLRFQGLLVGHALGGTSVSGWARKITRSRAVAPGRDECSTRSTQVVKARLESGSTRLGLRLCYKRRASGWSAWRVRQTKRKSLGNGIHRFPFCSWSPGKLGAERRG